MAALPAPTPPRIEPPKPERPSKLPTQLTWLAAVPLLLIGLSFAGFLFVRSQSPYGAAVAKATSDARVKAALGAPVEASQLFGGKGSASSVFDGTGQAKMSVELIGAKQSGTLLIAALKTSGVWGFSKLEVHTADGKVIDLANHPR